MNTFSANFSSSPATNPFGGATPQKRPFLFSPAEPSTTPAAPPPSSIFGSSDRIPNASRFKLGRERDGAQARPNHNLFSSRPPQPGSHGTALSQFNTSTASDTADLDSAYDDDDDDDDMGSSDPVNGLELRAGHNERGLANHYPSAQSLLKFSTNGGRQSVRPTSRNQTRKSRSQLPYKGTQDVIARLGKDLIRSTQTARLTEDDATILGTEQILRQLDNACQESQNDVEQSIVISGAAQELLSIWKKAPGSAPIAVDHGHIGPAQSEVPFRKARFVTTFLLELYHPRGEVSGNNDPPSSQGLQTSRIQTKPVPQILLEWINLHHNGARPLLDTVTRRGPNPAASDFFWDAVHTFVLRGQFSDLMHLLAEADFNYAVIDTPNGSRHANFSGLQLQAIQAAIYQVRQTINECPALQDNDWRIDGSDWDLYRKHVEEAIGRLDELADEHADTSDIDSLNSENLSKGPNSQSGLPYSVYQQISRIYNILLGDTDVILGLAQDWLEASLFLTIWWNGSDEAKVAQWSFDVSRASQPDTDLRPSSPYLQRLKESFLCVTDPGNDNSFRLNTLSSVEVALGCALQGDTFTFLGILQTLSLCISSAVAELGTWSGWLANSTPADGLDQQDLVVLNYGIDNGLVDKDDILLDYATALFQRKVLHAVGESIVPGWEVAFSITSRIDETDRIQSTISKFLETLPVTDADTAEKLITVCTELGLAEQGCHVSEIFGDHLVDTTSQYGTALLCYARAHSSDKVRQLIDLLNSYCLVQSKAFPLDHEMDEHLRKLVSNPRTALSNIVEIDPAAAEALQSCLVGYACLRRFYTLRDGVHFQHDQQPALQPIARKRTAAKALVAAINSAADSIYGGLYDSARRSAIQVDGLLPLLGEVTAMLADSARHRILTTDQMYAVLAAIEDLETVSENVFRATEECMAAALRNFHGSAPPSPHAMLKKSVSSGLNSNFSFSMMGSEMLSRSGESFGVKSFGSTDLEGDLSRDDDRFRRGWDWRARFADHDVTAKDVLRYLRLNIANELSLAVLGG